MRARRIAPKLERSFRAPAATAFNSPLTRARSLTAAACYAQLRGHPADAARAFDLATAHAQNFELAASLSAGPPLARAARRLTESPHSA